MPSTGRRASRMTEDESWALVAEQRKLQVATIGRDGRPHLATLFHTVLDGRLAFWTYAKSQKIRNLDRDPRLTCLVEAGDEYEQLRASCADLRTWPWSAAPSSAACSGSTRPSIWIPRSPQR